MKIATLAIAFVLMATSLGAQSLTAASHAAVCPANCVPVTVVQTLLDDADPYKNQHRALLLTFGTLAAMDLGRSLYEFGQQNAYELNPLLAHAQDHPERFAAIKAGINGGLIWYLGAQRRQHPKAVIGATLLAIGVQGYIVARNYQTAARLEQR